MSKRKLIRFLVFLFTLLCAFFNAIEKNVEAELICLFITFINYKSYENEAD